MIYKDGTNETIERLKKRLNMSGDVYMVEGQMANLASHKRLYPESTATNIAAAEVEKLEFMQREEEQRRLEAEKAEAARQAEHNEKEDLPEINPFWVPPDEG